MEARRTPTLRASDRLKEKSLTLGRQRMSTPATRRISGSGRGATFQTLETRVRQDLNGHDPTSAGRKWQT